MKIQAPAFYSEIPYRQYSINDENRMKLFNS